MAWSDFYLFCFIVGFSLSVLSFLAGAVHIHLPFRLHLPFQGGHHAGGLHSSGHAHAGGHSSWFNTSTLLAFLAWFGGTGYILTNYSNLVAIASLGLATLAGLVSGSIVFKFMVKLMHSSEAPLNEADYRVEGSVCTVTLPIRANGTGEVVFLLGGVRRSAGARTDDGKPIEKGAEVVIERHENGIAYVKRWDEFTS
ncbi:MAG TPA: NfeD family protein [Candidatus Acidoferrum sp.]|nr:NfeD family protein [Candidatus Acidoferrum sp.]